MHSPQKLLFTQFYFRGIMTKLRCRTAKREFRESCPLRMHLHTDFVYPYHTIQLRYSKYNCLSQLQNNSPRYASPSLRICNRFANAKSLAQIGEVLQNFECFFDCKVASEPCTSSVDIAIAYALYAHSCLSDRAGLDSTRCLPPMRSRILSELLACVSLCLNLILLTLHILQRSLFLSRTSFSFFLCSLKVHTAHKSLHALPRSFLISMDTHTSIIIPLLLPQTTKLHQLFCGERFNYCHLHT